MKFRVTRYDGIFSNVVWFIPSLLPFPLSLPLPPSFLPPQSAATVYSPYDGVVKEIIIQENETAYLEKPLVVFETDSDVGGK